MSVSSEDSCGDLVPDGFVPVEYIWKGGAQVLGASLYSSGEESLLKGRLRAKSFTMLSPSQVVRVEAIGQSRKIIWSGTARIKRDPSIRFRRSRFGTFRVALPDLETLDHFHIGVVARRDSSDILPGTCLSLTNS